MDTLPPVEKGIPLPVKKSKPDQRRERKPSPWPAFLQALEAGDSFLIEYPAANTVKAHARALGIKLVWRREGNGPRGTGPRGMAQERVWRAE